MAGPTGAGAQDTPAAAESVMLLGVGDTHGEFAPLFEAARREPAARAILQVGDLTAGKAGREQRPDDDPATLRHLPLPLVWVHGNHEHWEWLGVAESGPKPVLDPERSEGEGSESRSLPSSAARAPKSPASPDAGGRMANPTSTSDLGPRTGIGYHLWPGDEYVVPGTQIRVVGLPGNYAPTWYHQPKPFPGDRVRHFNAADVAALERFRRPSVLLLHESFRGQAPGRVGYMGIPVLTQLVRRLRPRVCLTGHHHTFAATERGGTLAIALPRAGAGYVHLRFAPSGALLAWDFVPLGEGG